VPKHYGRTCAISQDHGLEKTLDSTTLLELAKPALESENRSRDSASAIQSVVGTMTGSELTAARPSGLPDDTSEFISRARPGSRSALRSKA